MGEGERSPVPIYTLTRMERDKRELWLTYRPKIQSNQTARLPHSQTLRLNVATLWPSIVSVTGFAALWGVPLGMLFQYRTTSYKTSRYSKIFILHSAIQRYKLVKIDFCSTVELELRQGKIMHDRKFLPVHGLVFAGLILTNLLNLWRWKLKRAQKSKLLPY